MKARYLMSCAIAAVLTGTAYAAPATAPMDAEASSADAGGAPLGDIIVTAQRRDESIQKVPVTI